MLGKIAIGLIICIAIMFWLMLPYMDAYNKKPLSQDLILASWIFIPLYVAVTGVYFLWKAGLV